MKPTLWADESRKRSLGTREKKILYERAGGKCEICEKEISFLEMQVGHKKAHSKGGNATLKNTACICYKCNNLMGTDNWNTFLKKMGKQPEKNQITENKNSLKELPLPKLKFLAKKFGVKVKGRTEEAFLSTETYAPTKTQFVNALSKKLSVEDVKNGLKEYVEPTKKKKRKKNSSFC